MEHGANRHLALKTIAWEAGRPVLAGCFSSSKIPCFQQEEFPVLIIQGHHHPFWATTHVPTMVTSTGGDIVCERAMYGGNRAWGHDSVGVSQTAPDWYLAEGCTGTGFETWVLVQNPINSPATVALVFMTPSGTQADPTETLPANSR
jgi:hypothetical protein